MKAKGCVQCSGIRMKADPCARCSGEPRFVAITEDRIIGLCPRCHANSDEPKRRYEVVSCATLEETMKAWDAMQDEIADTLRPEPKGPSTMPQQLIYEMNVTVRPGESTILRIPVDGNVISIAPLGDGSAVQIAATVNAAMNGAECDGPYEDRVLWCGRGGQALPTMEFAGYDKRYVGSVRLGTLQIWHFWEMREMRGQPAWDDMASSSITATGAAAVPDIATRLWDTPHPMPEMREKSPAKSAVTMSRELGAPYVPAVMEQHDLDKLIRDLATGTEIDPEDYDVHELGWIFGHLDEINEWVAGERRIAELKTALRASLTK